MTPRVNIDRRGKGLDVDGFLYAPPDPVLLRGKGGDVLFPEMVLVVAGVLEHCRLVFAESVGRGGSVFLETSSCGPFGFAYVYVWAWLMVNTCTWLVVYDTDFFFFFQLVLRFD